MNTLTPEERKEYNKIYYEKNGTVILEKLTKKVECEFCHRTVSAVNLIRHCNLPICKKYQIIWKTKNERLNDINNV
jgi:hypothetical protein